MIILTVPNLTRGLVPELTFEMDPDLNSFTGSGSDLDPNMDLDPTMDMDSHSYTESTLTY